MCSKYISDIKYIIIYYHITWKHTIDRDRERKNTNWNSLMIIVRSLCTLQGSVLCVFSSQISYVYINQWRIQEFQNQGAQSIRGRILRSEICFEAKSPIPYILVVRVVNKIHIINIVLWPKCTGICMLYSHNLTPPPTPQKNSNQGARACLAGPGSAFVYRTS